MKEYLQIRNNGEITLPPAICRASKLQEGDLQEAAVEEDGSICLVPKGTEIRKLVEQSQLIGHQNRSREPKSKAGSLSCLSTVDALNC